MDTCSLTLLRQFVNIKSFTRIFNPVFEPTACNEMMIQACFYKTSHAVIYLNVEIIFYIKEKKRERGITALLNTGAFSF